MTNPLTQLQSIHIQGARVNNLKNVSLHIPKNKLVVITGVSGSGKSSLAFDTLYAEGQRRYVESLSSYARQFLGRMNKPDVDYINGISPAIAIEQKVNSRNPRSTVGTTTEIYEYLKLLFARIGKTYSPLSGKLVKRHRVSDVVNFVLSLPNESQALVLAPLNLPPKRTINQQLGILMQQGFSRCMVNGEVKNIEDTISSETPKKSDKVFIVVDRLLINSNDPDLSARIADSVQTAFYEGKDQCLIDFKTPEKQGHELFSSSFAADGIQFEEPSVNMFTFNNPYGACKRCEGFGSIIGIDEDLVIPNKGLSVYEGAIACWKGEKMGEWKDQLIRTASKFDFPVHKPYYALSAEQKQLLWTGNEYFQGLNDFFQELEEQTYKIQYRVMLSRYRGKTVCPECQGTRLRKDASYVKVAGKSISELVLMPLDQLYSFFTAIELDETDRQIAKRLLSEITNRIQFLLDVGLSYLTLNRLSNSLSGGESQRINLATSLGSSLVGSTYILDEPSIGLHSRDTERLIKVLKKLRDIGNTVIVVEHDEDIMQAADQIIDIGPEAGRLGGELIFQGSGPEIMHHPISLTGKYLSGKLNIPVPAHRRGWHDYIEIKGASQNNLKQIDVKFPLNVLTVISGVSGSGKSSLVRSILYPALRKHLGGYAEKTGSYGTLEGDLQKIGSVEMIDQNPIGRSSRSNPATYVKAYDDIRQLFADQKLAKARFYKPGFFSFNVPGGRCDQCEGEGTVKVEMQFMADVYLVCEVCGGKRFKEEVLDIRFEGKNIADVLDMTINEAIEFFGSSSKSKNQCNKIVTKLQPLQDVGLGYLKLGQSSSTLSGGEAQRIKLAFFLSKGATEQPTLFIFDEPTTGLHFHDINKLLVAFQALIENGHSVLVIEHHPDIIKSADWLIELGPEGGINGGHLIFEGTPETLAKQNNTHTAHAIQSKL
ncbi:MAG: excinuclease ABC subunit UvrA [Bacteroidales bacterium]|jgi:excinuclease ABC subunit A|nr:excinuclease ABC subunit UvrA [Bacteroidales bacterium]